MQNLLMRKKISLGPIKQDIKHKFKKLTPSKLSLACSSVKKGSLCMPVVLFCLISPPAFSAGPSDIDSGIKLWLDASDLDGDFIEEGTSEDGLNVVTVDGVDEIQVVTWADKSGNDVDLTVRDSFGSPAYISEEATFFNGRGVVDFNAGVDSTVGDVMSHDLLGENDDGYENAAEGTIDWSGDHSIFIVFKQQTLADAFDGFFSSGTTLSDYGVEEHFQISVGKEGENFAYRTTNRDVAYELQDNTTTKLYAATKSSDTVTTYSDGSMIEIDDLVTDGQVFDEYILNANRNTKSFNDSQIAEVIIYNRKLDSCEMATINAYLGTKYGKDFSGISSYYDETGVTSHPYPHSTDGSFSGIGSFLDSGCDESLVVESTAQADMGGLTASISAPYDENHNLDLVSSDEFTTFGYDDGGLVEVTGNTLDYETRIERTWLVDQDDATGTDYIENFTINFNITDLALTKTAADFALLIDDDGDGDFVNARVHTEGAMEVDSDNISFSGVDFPVDGAVFTLATEVADNMKDTDGDGIIDSIEIGTDTNNPIDSDDDGIPDYLENNLIDSDQDGIFNYLDDDDDGDGISGSDEIGSDFNNPIDSDNDGIPDYLENNLIDTDQDGTFNYLDSDDDGDGILTIDELDTGYRDPIDSDADGIADYLENNLIDSDNDGIPDYLENNLVDSDQDGILNYLDDDDDGDGISGSDEIGPDFNNPIDSDSDGIPDYLENNLIDTDQDGTLNYLDSDDDGDGVLTIDELDSGYRDPIDSDADGIADYLEDNLIDTDQDGILNYLDTDDDGDGIPTVDEIGPDSNNPIDTDGDGIPDFLQATTSDNGTEMIQTGVKGGSFGIGILSILGLLFYRRQSLTKLRKKEV